MKRMTVLIVCLLMSLLDIATLSSHPFEGMYFYRTLFNLAFGGLKNIEEGIERNGLYGFFKDWKTPYGACETLPSLAFDIIADTQEFFDNEKSTEQWQSTAHTSLKTALTARTLLPGYQKELFTDATARSVSDWLVQDIRKALIIFGNLNPKEINRLAIVPLNERAYENWDYVHMLWLGIVPTSTTLYVDETFLSQFRKDPLMYGFILAYGVEHYKKSTVRNRTFMNMLNVGLRTFIGMKMFSMISDGITNSVNSAQQICEKRVPSIALWNSKPVVWFDTTHKNAYHFKWLPYLAICGTYFVYELSAYMIKMSIAETCSDFCMGFYDKVNKTLQRSITGRTAGSINIHHLTYIMQQWFLYYQTLPLLEEYAHLKDTLAQQRHYTLHQRIEHIKNNYFAVWIDSEKELALRNTTQRSIDNASRLSIFARTIDNLNLLNTRKTYSKVIR